MTSIFLNRRYLALALVAASTAALAFAYISQYGFGLEPCILCLYQRKPYFAAIALGLLAAGVSGKCKKTTIVLLLLCCAAFLTGMGIAGFHVGVEQGWWPGTAACGGATLPENATLAELRNYLLNRKIVRCDIPAFSLFGISMTGYNFLLSAFLAAFSLFFTWKGRKA